MRKPESSSPTGFLDELWWDSQSLGAPCFNCMEHNIPIDVLNYLKPVNIERAIAGERLGTRVSSTPG